MIQVSKDEKTAILKKYPDVGIVRTVKQKSKRHRYYMEERKDAMYELRRMRGEIPNNKRRNKNTYNRSRGLQGRDV